MRALLSVWCACALWTLCAQVGAAVDMHPVGPRGAYLGFDLRLDGRVIAPVRFSSNSLIVAGRCKQSRMGSAASLRFLDLHGKPGSGLTLGAGDAVTVQLHRGDRYPCIYFRLTIKGFDPEFWQRAAGGPCPFHFLTISMPQAEAWHQRGWLNATPLADPFPLLQDVHVGSPEIASNYSRNWSYTPPLGAQPMPVIGLWAPLRRLYVGLEFQRTRLLHNSEKDIATAYCWKQGRDRQFITLAYPHGGRGYQSLVFPRPGDAIASYGILLYSTDLPATADPNRFVWQIIWARDAQYLPQAPTGNDLSWIPGGSRLKDFEGPPGPGLVGGVEARFQVEGSRLLHGWYRHKEGSVPHLVRSGNAGQIQRLTGDLRYLLTKTKRFQVGGDECVYWEKPLEGRWTDDWGGAPVTTLRNSDGFIVARTWLDLYDLRDTPVASQVLADLGLTPAQVLEIVEGCFNWARHITWTRNEFADVPSSPFAIGGTLTSAFCLDYYFTFRGDPARRERAEQALDLARTFVYRYLTMWPSDNDRSDRFDSAFLWEPNSGRDWCGAACANEVTWCLDTLAMVAVNTADPILIHALRGTLDRWHLLYKERYHDSLADYEHDALTEGYALYDDTVYGERGARASYGWGPGLPMLEPVGDSAIRVLAGMKTALAFSKGGVKASVADYRCASPTSFQFVVRCEPPGPHDLSLTFPFSDLSAAPVWIERRASRRALAPGKALRRPPQALWSLHLREVCDGDLLIVGGGARRRPPALSGPADTGRPTLPPLSRRLGFRPLALQGRIQAIQNWRDPNSWAGLPSGLRWAYRVPLVLSDPPASVSQSVALREPVQGPALLLLLYEARDALPPSVYTSRGVYIRVSTAHEALAWQAWPPIYTTRLLIAPVFIPRGHAARTVFSRGGALFAATALALDSPETSRVLQLLVDGGQRWRKLQQAERSIAAFRAVGRSRALERLAILPYGDLKGRLAHVLGKSRLVSWATQLRPEQLTEPDGLTPERFPVVLDLDGEDYIKTVKEEGDAAAAVLRYLRDGGFLVLAADGPYPMYYGLTPQGRPSDPLLPKMGLHIKGFEEPPEEEQIRLVISPNQQVLEQVPGEVAFPGGDQRLRAVEREKVPADATYTPIYTARGRDGTDYGDAACLLELAGGGKVLYVWFGLMRDPEAGPAIAEALLRYILAALPAAESGHHSEA